jgi:hypothetical protein
METYYEPSISAYNLLNEVLELLDIKEAPEISVRNGNVNKIISSCNEIIDDNYEEGNTKELLKYYIARSFFDDYNLEIEEDFQNIPIC